MERDPATASFNLQNTVADLLPNLPEPEKRAAVQNMRNMSSGLRDSWALTTLWGARPEDRFTMTEHAPEMRKRLRSSHFEPGAEFSYSNANFQVLGLLAEEQAGRPLAEVLAERLFRPAGMTTAQLGADTSQLPGPCKGYEGDETHGFTPAVNRIVWEGDAGVIASLEDMIAYEKHLHQSWSDPKSIYCTLAEEQKYTDGTPSIYGNGLIRNKIGGFAALGHGGALRGYRLNRRHIPQKNLSAIVMFNHEADAADAASTILKRAMTVAPEKPPDITPSPEWEGIFLDADTQRAITVTLGDKGKVYFSNRRAESINLTTPSQAKSQDMTASINGDVLEINHITDHRKYHAKRLKGTLAPGQTAEYIGIFYCNEIESTFHCTGDGKSGMLYGAFDGFMGQGPEHTMRYAGDDVWLLANPRGLDAPAPGDWTLVFHRNNQGSINGVTIGCWLARKLEYIRQ